MPTPLTYFAAYELGCHSCVSVTGSHNPPDYNGLKMVIGGETLALDARQQLKARIEAGDLLTGNGTIRRSRRARRLCREDRRRRQALAPMKIVMDCGNGVAGGIAPALFGSSAASWSSSSARSTAFPEPPPGSVEAGEPRRTSFVR